MELPAQACYPNYASRHETSPDLIRFHVIDITDEPYRLA